MSLTSNYLLFALRAAAATAGRILCHPANKRRRGRVLGLYLAWQLWERLVRRPWTIRLGDAHRLRLYPHSCSAALVLYLRMPEYEEMAFVRAYLRPGDLFVDVGANVGVYSLWAAETEAVSVLAFEPSSLAYRRALENVELNDLHDRVRLLNKAVGAEPTFVHLTLGLDAVNQVVTADVEAVGTGVEVVEQTTLDGEVASRSVPAIIKIDVEGLELDVLRGARGVLARHRPALIIEANDVDGLTDLLAEIGYALWSYDPVPGLLSPTVAKEHLNVIALADVDGARRRVTASV